VKDERKRVVTTKATRNHGMSSSFS
jgi:hypothetical protein